MTDKLFRISPVANNGHVKMLPSGLAISDAVSFYDVDAKDADFACSTSEWNKLCEVCSSTSRLLASDDGFIGRDFGYLVFDTDLGKLMYFDGRLKTWVNVDVVPR